MHRTEESKIILPMKTKNKLDKKKNKNCTELNLLCFIILMSGVTRVPNEERDSNRNLTRLDLGNSLYTTEMNYILVHMYIYSTCS
jgi:hypothetical protein